ncbi:hypothetical protein J2S78_002798 [Salibacterium salarium]|nr:hypothetical protein [Salibacterium salarium]
MCVTMVLAACGEDETEEITGAELVEQKDSD